MEHIGVLWEIPLAIAMAFELLLNSGRTQLHIFRMNIDLKKTLPDCLPLFVLGCRDTDFLLSEYLEFGK